MRIVTWNVNGIRACTKKGFLDWFQTEKPDVLCLQETKAHPEQVTPEVANPEGYTVHAANAVKRGYSGVWTYTLGAPESARIGLDDERFDCEGRIVISDHGPFVLVNGYYPNSQRGGARLPYKLEFFKVLMERCAALRAEGKELILTGDFNACHTHLDIENAKQNEKNAGFLPEERAWVDSMLALGYRDIYRDRNPGEKGHYTWWTYRANARARNIGWRLDYFLLTPGLVDAVKDVKILSDIHGSDHCPVRLDLNL